jgi:hypothetical protein
MSHHPVLHADSRPEDRPETRKVFEGVASRQQMYAFFNRHAQAPFDEERISGRCYAGEWFEIAEGDHDRMFEILPPLIAATSSPCASSLQRASPVFLRLAHRRSRPLVPRLLRSRGAMRKAPIRFFFAVARVACARTEGSRRCRGAAATPVVSASCVPPGA